MKKQKNKMTKAIFCLTIDREEELLNEMCAQGWKPVKIWLGLWFRFERCEPGEYIARVTTGIDVKGSRESRQRREQLIEYLTDSGAEIVPEINIDAHSRVYAVRPAKLGPFEINTDTDALIADYTARRKYHIQWAILSAVFMLVTGLLSGWMYYDYLAVRETDPSAAQMTMGSLRIECVASLALLLCIVCLVIPIPAYTRKIRELREKREFEE